MALRQLHLGDNLTVLRESVGAGSVDLVYLDPPFNSRKVYSAVLGAGSMARAFGDTWRWGEDTDRELARTGGGGDPALHRFLTLVRDTEGESGLAAYCVMMAPRLAELKRVLKPTGSIYLHCDGSAGHYLKIMMDTVFGRENFQNEIVWKRTSAHNRARRWGPVHDSILFYTRTGTYVWNRITEAYSEGYLNTFYRHVDGFGRYRLGDLTGPGKRGGSSGDPWRGVDPTPLERHWELPHDRALPPRFTRPPGYPLMTVQERLDVLDAAGLVHWPPGGGKPSVKRYLLEGAGTPVQDIVVDIPPLADRDSEKTGFPTQKPLKLVERIVKASSPEGGVVLDPFCGSGTSLEAAERLGRQWIGIDMSHLAIAVTEQRLNRGFGHVRGFGFEVLGTPRDLESAVSLASRDVFQFRSWACSLLGAAPRGRHPGKGSDRRVHGSIPFNDEGRGSPGKRIVVSVTAGRRAGPSVVRALAAAMEREDAPLGICVTLGNPTRRMGAEAREAGTYLSGGRPVPKIQISTVESLLSGVRPEMPLDLAAGGRGPAGNRPVPATKPGG